MAIKTTDHEIRARIDSFLTELSGLVRKSALQSVHAALGGGVAPRRRRGPGRPKGSGRRHPGRPRKAAYAERVIGTIRRKCLDHLIVFGEEHARCILDEYVRYYDAERDLLGMDPPDSYSPAATCRGSTALDGDNREAS